MMKMTSLVSNQDGLTTFAVQTWWSRDLCIGLELILWDVLCHNYELDLLLDRV